MQPIFCSFTSGVRYRKTVKLYFRSILRFYLLVSIYENASFGRFLSFLTAGNKSKCGTLQRLTDPQQSTVNPIFRPVSPRKRQALQRKPIAPSPISTQTSSHLREHRTSVPPAKKIGLQTHLHPRYSQALPRHSPSHSHSRSPPSAPPAKPTSTSTPQTLPRHAPPSAPALPPHPKVACNSQTGVTQQHKVIRTSKLVRGNCMRNCST